MTNPLYQGVDLMIDESRKEIVINPRGERFYFVECEEQSTIFINATLCFNEEQNRYEIEGDQILYTEHNAFGHNYEKLLCIHPKELIVKKSFLGFVWYRVLGVMKRKVRTHYLCSHERYRIYRRLEMIEQTIQEG